MEPVQLLQLLQLCDSASPIGATAHSFGLETLTAEETIATGQLEEFLRDYIREAGALEASFCRAAYALHAACDEASFEVAWVELNVRLSALKPAREGRAASAMLGRRFLRLVLDLEEHPLLARAVQLAQSAGIDIHYSAAFGLACGVLGFDVEASMLAYLQQMVTGLVSACQRLLPLGQSQAGRILWQLKPALLDAIERSRTAVSADSLAFCFVPLVDMGGMRHPTLRTRLFMS